jgi:hypothetical protein
MALGPGPGAQAPARYMLGGLHDSMRMYMPIPGDICSLRNPHTWKSEDWGLANLYIYIYVWRLRPALQSGESISTNHILAGLSARARAR